MNALRSMTGFAETGTEEEGRVVRAGVRSVNHRFLDLHAHLPDGLEALEPIVRRVIREKVKRGHLDVFVRVETTGSPDVRINRQAAEMYLQTAQELKELFGLKEEPDLGAILRLPGVVEASATGDASERERIGHALEQTLRTALERLDQMRAVEGARLGEEMSQATARIAEHVGKIQPISECARKEYAERLRERVAELAGDSTLDPGRLAQEVAQVAARSDTAEETTRLESHLDQFSRALEAGGEAGKKLDFLCQEMLREVNTTLAKTPALGPDGLEITRLVLAVKAEIEKLREQVQNIE
jgi:uncharacterized protein (TIGR00255 family)